MKKDVNSTSYLSGWKGGFPRRSLASDSSFDTASAVGGILRGPRLLFRLSLNHPPTAVGGFFFNYISITIRNSQFAIRNSQSAIRNGFEGTDQGVTGQDRVYLANCCCRRDMKFMHIRRASTFNTRPDRSPVRDPHINGVRLFLHYGDIADSTNLIKLLYRIQPERGLSPRRAKSCRVSFDIPEYTVTSRPGYGQDFGSDQRDGDNL